MISRLAYLGLFTMACAGAGERSVSDSMAAKEANGKAVNFDQAYIEKHRGTYTVDIPEVHELVNIAIAISNTGRTDSNMVDMTTPYHQAVIETFFPFRNHPLIQSIDSNLSSPGKDGYLFYYDLKANAAEYHFNRHGKLANNGQALNVSFSGGDNPIEHRLQLIEDFARQTRFRRFFRTNQPYYQSLIATYRQLNPIDRMWNWLEYHFPNIRKDHYRVTFSPLVRGAHGVYPMQDRGFHQLNLYIARAEATQPAIIAEMAASRVVFTEIDHGYVNPTSDKYEYDINNAFEEVGLWATDEAFNFYNHPMAIFNEYLTWALYSLYCIDHYLPSDVANYLPRMETFMEVQRGFIRFTEFNRFLMETYRTTKQQNPEINIVTLYPEILAWCMDQREAAVQHID